MTQTLTVQDIEVLIDGQGPTVVMLHGWPDSPALWDESVAALGVGGSDVPTGGGHRR